MGGYRGGLGVERVGSIRTLVGAQNRGEQELNEVNTFRGLQGVENVGT